MSHVDRIARLRIALDNWQPAIWRRVEVPLTASLKALHDVIQAVMPFDDHHLFEFHAGGQRFAIPDPEWDFGAEKTLSAKTTKLGLLIDRGITELGYTYDFGDDWRHTITVEAAGPADPATDYPRYLDGARRAPPEDVGGLQGFENFLAAIADPAHPDHEELTRWHGEPFDPAVLDEDVLRARIEKLARLLSDNHPVRCRQPSWPLPPAGGRA